MTKDDQIESMRKALQQIINVTKSSTAHTTGAKAHYIAFSTLQQTQDSGDTLPEGCTLIPVDVMPLKIHYCNKCNVEEVLDSDQPSICPFCGGDPDE